MVAQLLACEPARVWTTYTVDYLSIWLGGYSNRLLWGEWTDLCSSWHVVCIVHVSRGF